MEFTVQKRTEDRMLVYHFLEDWAKQDLSNHIFLDFEGELWTYKRFYLAVQRVGNWLMNDLGIKKDEVVALDGPNSSSYLLLWFALEGIGAVPAFINSNLTGESLQHCVKVSQFDFQQALDEKAN
jgi:acyl-CoA synthetase (AMP-forming)/AMP-acid ligase II